MKKEKFIDSSGKEIYEISCKTVYEEEDFSPHIVCAFTLKNISDNWDMVMDNENHEEFISDAFDRLRYFLRDELHNIQELNKS
jgi:hypothetical protein